jgi:hypothetical protein
MGFGPVSVVVLAAGLLGLALGGGVARVGGALLAVLAIMWMGYRYWQYNGSPWRRVHFRAMRYYARVAGVEAAQAEAEGREFDPKRACLLLGLVLCGEDKRLNVNAMVEALEEERGDYLAGLILAHGRGVWPGADDQKLARLADALRSTQLGPQLIIANVVENTFGATEAVRYVVALARGDAF